MHNRLVGLVLEIAVPSTLEIGGRPGPHLCQLLLRWSDLHTSIDTIGGQWTCSAKIPLLEDLLLDLGIATDEVVEGFGLGLRSVDREGEVVVLEVGTDAWQVDQRPDASPTQLLGVANSGALQNLRRAESSSTDDDLFTCPVDLPRWVTTTDVLRGNRDHADGSAVLDDDLVDLGVDLEMEIVVFGSSAVDVCMGGITSSTCPESI